MTKSQPDILVNPVQPGPQSFIRALFHTQLRRGKTKLSDRKRAVT